MQSVNDEQVKRILLDLLSAFDDICKLHSIRYSLDSGTLLGAVRHGGFIPWDDDVDVIVPRPDYERLLDHPEWFSAPLDLLPPLSAESIFPFAKLITREWRAQEPVLNGVMNSWLWLDIFPVDAIPFGNDEADHLYRKQRDLIKIASRSIGLDDRQRGTFKYALKKIGLPLHRLLFPTDKLFRKVERKARKIPYGTTDNVANITWLSVPKGRAIPTADFDALIKMEFEDKEFSVIPHWHEYLSGLYGDYMTLPPEGQRVSHGAKVWKV